MRSAADSVPSLALPFISRLAHPRKQLPRASSSVAPNVNSKLSDKWIYTAQLFGHDLQIYQQEGVSLTFFEFLNNGVDSPQGMVGIPNGTWYVANGGHSNVLIYNSSNQGPSKDPIGSLDDAGQFPANVDATASRRLVAVSSAQSLSGGTGSVSVYLNRSAEPTRILTYGSDLLLGEGIAIDHQSNCYWSFNDLSTGGGSIVVFPGCAMPGTPLITGLPYAGGLAFDQKGDLFYLDQTLGLYQCTKLSKCTNVASGFGDPVNINFDQKSKDLWIADATGYIDAFDPKTEQVVYTTASEGGSSDPPFGIAAAPGAK